MPTARQLVTVSIVAALCAVVVTLVLHAVGLGEHAAIAAAVSAATAATVATRGFRRADAAD